MRWGSQFLGGWLSTFSRTQHPIIKIYLGALQHRDLSFLSICFIKLHLEHGSFISILFCVYLFYFVFLLLGSLPVKIPMMNIEHFVKVTVGEIIYREN